jgi:N-acetylneuraminic acid mutarotase
MTDEMIMRAKPFLLITSLLLLAFASPQQSGKWQLIKTTNTAEGRSECGLAAVNAKLYLLGGDGEPQPVEVFDIATSTWSKKAVAPVSLHHFQAVTLGDKVYVLDAFYQGNFPDQLPAPNPYCYDTKTDSWQTLAGLPEHRRRAGAGAAEYKGKLYLVAGIQHGHKSGTTDMFDMYDPATNTWTALPSAPHIRDHCQAVVVNDKLYALGGRNTSYHEHDNFMAFFSKTVLDVDCYDFKTGKWSTLSAKLPLGSGGGIAVNLDGKIFYIGGERATETTPNAPQKDVYYLDPETGGTWAKAADLNVGRNGVGGAVYDHKIYIAGGVPNGPPRRLLGPPARKDKPNNQPPGDVDKPQPSDISLEVFGFL